MFNFEVDAGSLEPFVPAGTTLDRWQGRTYASIVGFGFLETRVLGLPIPFHRHFDEINLRCYVRRDVGGERRRGVVFPRELVPRRAVALIARWVFGEPYRALPMKSEIETNGRLAVSYAWRAAGRWHTLTAHGAAPSAQPPEGSLEQFIAEHYWGYTRRPGRPSLEYQVTHPPWMVVPADAYRIDADLSTAYGRDLGAALQQPTSVFLATGSEVAVSFPSPCRESRDGAP